MIGRRRVSLLSLLALIGAASVLATAAYGTTTTTDDVAHDGGLQWGFDRIGAAEAWQAGRGSGVVVAVVDSGVDLDHEDLAGQLVGGTACRSTGGDPDECSGSPQDADGHGTHVAGIIAAKSGNRVGIAGVAPDARVMPIKVLFNSSDCAGERTCPSTGGPDDVVAAIRWAIEHGADIINLSLGSSVSNVFGPEFLLALEEAWDAGVIPVIAAGNSYVQSPDFADAHAIVVAATNRDDGAPGYSTGVGQARWSVAAPGGDEGDTAATCAHGGDPRGILSTFWSPDDNDSYACLSGTSMAAPHVSGALAVLLSMDRYTTASAAVDRLLSTSVDLGEPGVDDTFGAGLIDLAAAADVASSTTSSTTSTTTPDTTSSTTTSAPASTTSVDPTSTAAPSTTLPPSTTSAAPVIVDDDPDPVAAPMELHVDERSVGTPLAVGAGLLALGVAGAGTALRRRGLL